MDDFIKRADALKVIETANSMVSSLIEATMKLCVVMDRIAAADVAPVRHGRWVEVEVKELAYYKMMIASMRCDQCGRYHNKVYHYGNPTEMAKYCGFCGALMDKDGDGDV